MKYLFFALCFSIFTFSQEPQYVQKAVTYEEIDENEPLPLPVVDNPPVFKGCELETTQEKRNCFMLKLKAIFDDNFKYPKASEKVNHRFFVNFIVDKNGVIKLDAVVRCKDKLIEEEVRKIFKKIPKAIPATDKNKAVNVKILLPFDIKWDDK